MKKQQTGFSTIEIVIVLAVIGVIGLVGWMVMGRGYKANDVKTSSSAPADKPTPTESGTCFGVSKTTVKSLLGDSAKNLTGPSDTGVQEVGKGDKAQTCVYPFKEGDTADNSFMIDVGTYANQSNLTDSQKYITEDAGASVAGLGDSANYLAKDVALNNTRDFVLTIRQDLKIYKFEISQPKGALTFSDASAQTALVKIAQAATL